MKTAFITSGYLPVPPSKGGAVENLIYNLILENEKHNDNKFTVFSIEDDSNNKYIYKNTEIQYISVNSIIKALDKSVYFIAKNILRKKHLISYRYFFQRMAFLKKVGKCLESQNFDKVILENNITMFKALTYKQNFEKYKDKIYYHAHNELGITMNCEKYLNYTKKIICVSAYISNCYQKIINNKHVKCEVLRNTVNQDIFLKDITTEETKELKEKLGLNLSYITIVFTGRISREKGILELLEGLYKSRLKEFNLIIVGNEFYNTKMKSTTGAYVRKIINKLEGNIVFTGYVPYEEMYKYYQIADICVLPSVWNDPAPLTVIECIMSGTPLITTNAGGIPEYASKSTILLNTDNLVDDLAQQFNNLTDNKPYLDAMKKQAAAERNIFYTTKDYYKSFIKMLK